MVVSMLYYSWPRCYIIIVSMLYLLNLNFKSVMVVFTRLGYLNNIIVSMVYYYCLFALLLLSRCFIIIVSMLFYNCLNALLLLSYCFIFHGLDALLLLSIDAKNKVLTNFFNA